MEAIEAEIGRSLPKSYRDFVCEYGGAFVGGEVLSSEQLSILEFFGASKVLENIRYYDDLREAGILPIGRDELGDLWVIDTDGSVNCVIYYEGVTRAVRVGADFADMLSRIVVVT